MVCDNVKIPISLLSQSLNVLEYVYDSVEIQKFAPDFLAFFVSVLWQWRQKALSLELREACSKMVTAKTDADRHVARIEYLRLKHELDAQF